MTTKHTLEEAIDALARFMSRQNWKPATWQDAETAFVHLREFAERFEALERAVSRLEARPSSLSELVDASKLGPRRNCIPSIEVRPLSDEEAAQLVKDLDLAKGRESASGNAPMADGAVVGGAEEAVRSPDPEPVVPEKFALWPPWYARLTVGTEPPDADGLDRFVARLERAAHEHFDALHKAIVAPLLSRAEAAERERDQWRKFFETELATEGDYVGDEPWPVRAGNVVKKMRRVLSERDADIQRLYGKSVERILGDGE